MRIDKRRGRFLLGKEIAVIAALFASSCATFASTVGAASSAKPVNATPPTISGLSSRRRP
jgi:hypothetical protein